MRTRIQARICSAVLAVGAITCAAAAEPAAAPYPAPASFDAFRFAVASEEIALARSAAPASISDDAEVLALAERGYETAVRGKNGFVCLVQRSWANTFANGEFWNPKIRAPICLNPAAVRSVLPIYLERTRWVLSGVSKEEMAARTNAEISARTLPIPDAGAMSYMMSKQGYINDEGRHWYAHVMFFMPRATTPPWGANSPGAPVFSDDSDVQPVTTFFVLVPKWSDGSLVFPDKT